MKNLKEKEKKLNEKKKIDLSKEKKHLTKKEFAHQRFQHLAQEVPKGLNLPLKYQVGRIKPKCVTLR